MIITEIAICLFFIAALYIMYISVRPSVRVEEYISWYKVGRILQMAEANKIDIPKTIEYDNSISKPLLKSKKTWTEKIEDDLADKLGEVKKKEDKSPKKDK